MMFNIKMKPSGLLMFGEVTHYQQTVELQPNRKLTCVLQV